MNTLLDGKPMENPQRPGSTVSTTSVRPASSKLGTFTLVVALVSLALLGYVAYDLSNTKTTLKKSNDDIASLSQKLDSADHRIVNLGADFSVVKEKLGITQRELDTARAQAAQMQKEQQQTAQDLQQKISTKAEAEQVNQLQQETSTKFGAVSGEVSNVKTDVEKTKKDLESARRELLDVRDTLSTQIAHNAKEVNELRRKGERNYIEFELDRKQGFKKVGDISLRLLKADHKHKRYSIMVSVDDNSLEKKNRNVDEPVQFLVGKNHVRYEIVVYQVNKNKVSGYLSIPKDAKLSGENPRGGE